jgi:hypothetical protein
MKYRYLERNKAFGFDSFPICHQSPPTTNRASTGNVIDMCDLAFNLLTAMITFLAFYSSSNILVAGVGEAYRAKY